MDNTTPQKIEEVFAKHPRLEDNGFRDLRSSRPDTEQDKHDAWQKRVISNPTAIQTAQQWIRANLTQRNTYNKKISSYGLKHKLEQDVRCYYITNGEFIVAMLLEGYEPKVLPDWPNCYFKAQHRTDSALK
jgi:hypothetical protein